MNEHHDAAVHQQLGRIEGKIDSLCAATSRAHDRLDKHDDRIGGLERGQAKLMAYATMLATGVSTAVALVVRSVFGS